MSEELPWCIHTISRLYSPTVRAGMPDGTWPMAVPLPYTGGRLKAAWWVLTGRAYAFAWPKPGDLEKAIGLNTFRPSLGALGGLPSGQGVQMQQNRAGHSRE